MIPFALSEVEGSLGPRLRGEDVMPFALSEVEGSLRIRTIRVIRDSASSSVKKTAANSSSRPPDTGERLLRSELVREGPVSGPPGFISLR